MRSGLRAMDANDLKDLFTEATKRMDTSLEHVKHELGGVRTGRASVTILDNTIAPTIADRIARAFGFASFGGRFGKHAAIIETKRSIPWEIACRASFSASRSSLPTDGSGHEDSKLSRCFVER